MAALTSLARPYAKAVFQEAQGHDVEKWSTLLSVLSFITQDKQAAHLIKDPEISSEHLVTLFLSIALDYVRDVRDELKTRFENFLQLLADNKRLNVLPDIDVLFKEFLAEEQRIEYVSVVSAAPLSQAIKRDLEEKLKARFKSEVNVEYSEDKALIGGAIVRTNRWVMDGSIRGKLAKIRDSLIAS